MINTNTAAALDTNLYAACIAFPADTNPYPTLQIALFRTNSVIIKANHFDYSAETDRDFALLVCDSVDKPTWKAVDLSGASDAQDGWLIQGSVPNWAVTDPMFLLVSNINLDANAFSRAVPYGGPQIVLTGVQEYDTVSNSVTLTAAITDLSGTVVSDQQPEVTVNGLPARWTRGTNNSISVDTRYAQNGAYQVVGVGWNSSPVVIDTNNPPMDTQLEYEAGATIALDFENSAFLVNSGDLAGPEVGTNYIVFGLGRADQISATILEPSSGRTLASYSGYVPYATYVALVWNFTEAGGAGYTNDSYAIHFVATNAPVTTLNVTNNISKHGVRGAAGVIITYAEEIPNPSNPADSAPALNDHAYQWIDQNLTFLYDDIYDTWGLTQYGYNDIGVGRNIFAKFVDNQSTATNFHAFLQLKLGSTLYSDITIGPMHGFAPAFGVHGTDAGTASSKEIDDWVAAAGNNWRMRKVAMWSCQSGLNGTEMDYRGYPPFYEAFGIRKIRYQYAYQVTKNAGLFFKRTIDQEWGAAQAEEALDQLWVTGPNGYPGGCEPTWAFSWALRQVLGQFPDFTKAKPFVEGFQWLIYSGVYDQELRDGDWSMIHQ